MSTAMVVDSASTAASVEQQQPPPPPPPSSPPPPPPPEPMAVDEEEVVQDVPAADAPVVDAVASPASPSSAVVPDVEMNGDAAAETPLMKTKTDATDSSSTTNTTTTVSSPTATADSTATVSTSTVSETPEEVRQKLRALAMRRLMIQIQFVENARKKIMDDTHPDLLQRLAPLERERDQLLQLAKLHEMYLQHCTSVIFTYECDEATSEFEMNCEKLRQDMLEEIQNEMEIINDQQKGGVSSARKTTRKTRSTRTKNGSDSSSSFALDTAQKIKKRAGNVFQPLVKKLAQSEVDQDVRQLTSVYELSKKRRIENAGTLCELLMKNITLSVADPFQLHELDTNDLPTAKYYRASFLYRDSIFQEGDEIYVQNFLTRSEYVAIICAMTSTELFVLSEKGKYYRLVIMDIRQDRILLSTLTPEQSAALAAREERAALGSS